ncbi:MAG: PKD domain-containing protein [Bacteroidia bacterium]|nr:PKD domain-containing protein [Bacteroidia bacterium]
MKKILLLTAILFLSFSGMQKLNAQCQAGFTVSDTSGTYYFTDTSLVTADTIASWAWNFGDGNVSTLQNPTHVYAACGWYVVSLDITTLLGCTNTFTDTVLVSGTISGSYTYTVNTANGNTQFSALPAAGNYNYAWDFGDASTGTGNNPSHTYTSGGMYTACVIFSDTTGACAADTVCNAVTVNIVCNASYTYTSAGPVFTFTDASTGGTGTITNWLWNFGDFATSNLQNPVHGYLNCGTYIVSLSIVTSNGCVNTFSDTVIVGGQITGSYTYNVDTTNGDVQFNALPNNSNMSFAWDFGDGNTGTNANPTNTYLPGTYNACVIITDNTGACMADTVCDSVVVYIAPPSCNSTFAANDLGGGQFIFTPQPFNFGWQYDWDFGDGNIANGFVGNNTYVTYGTYTVCLTSTDPSNGCTSVFCDTVVYAAPQPCSIDFTWTSNGGGSYDFTATTVNGGIFPVVVWVFATDGGATAFGATTTYQFTSNGLQVICASLNPPPVPAGCSDTICHFFFVSGVGIDENPLAPSLKIFPNPTQDQLSIQFDLSAATDVAIEVTDLLGNKVEDVYSAKNLSGPQNINCKTKDLASGIYFVKIRAGDNVITRKIIKN